MILERTMLYSLYTPYSIYFRMVVSLSISWGPCFVGVLRIRALCIGALELRKLLLFGYLESQWPRVLATSNQLSFTLGYAGL